MHHSVNAQPPYLSPGYPNYPIPVQVLRITGAAVPGTSPVIFPAVVEQWVNGVGFRDREACYVTERPTGRLISSFAGLPLYTLSSAGTTLTVRTDNLTLTIPDVTILEIDHLTMTLSNPSPGIARISSLGGGSSLEIVDDSGAPDIPGVTTLLINRTDAAVSPVALQLTNPLGQQAQLAVYYATVALDGVVSTTDQTFAGYKRFSDGGLVTGDSWTMRAGVCIDYAGVQNSMSNFAGPLAIFTTVPETWLGLQVDSIVGSALYGGDQIRTFLSLVADAFGTEGIAFLSALKGSVTTLPTAYATSNGSGTAQVGVTGTDSVGNTFSGGLITTIGSGGGFFSGTVP